MGIVGIIGNVGIISNTGIVGSVSCQLSTTTKYRPVHIRTCFPESVIIFFY